MTKELDTEIVVGNLIGTVEYDYQSTDDFYKVIEYAHFYKSDTEHVDEIKSNKITISFVCEKRPEKLPKYLRQERQMYIMMVEEGSKRIVTENEKKQKCRKCLQTKLSIIRRDIMKVYGTDICIDCRNYKAIQKKRGFEAEYIDITADTTNLKEFLAMRDQEELFANVRENHGIGIPLFVREDGVKTFDIDEAFSWIGQPPVEDEEIVERRFEGGCGPDGC